MRYQHAAPSSDGSRDFATPPADIAQPCSSSLVLQARTINDAKGSYQQHDREGIVAVGRSGLTCQSGRVLKRTARREVLDNIDIREQHQIFLFCFRSSTTTPSMVNQRPLLVLPE